MGECEEATATPRETAILRAYNEFVAWVDAEPDIKLDNEIALAYLTLFEGSGDDEGSDFKEKTKKEEGAGFGGA